MSAGSEATPPVLFLHGFMGRGQDFRNVIEHLQDRFHCLALDLPGHGRTEVSAGPEAYRMETVAEGVVTWLTSRGLVSPSLVGYSMGGRLALYLGVHFPLRFDRVILESASPGLADPAERAARRRHDEAVALRLRTEPFERFLEWWYRQPVFSSLADKPELLSSSMVARRENDPEKLATSLTMMSTGRQPSLWNRLSTLDDRLFLIVGKDDTKFVRIARRMAQRCRCQVRVIPEAGHIVHMEQPQGFTEAVERFLGV